MRLLCGLLIVLFASVTSLTGQEKKNPDAYRERFGLKFEAESYPQATPKEALASVIKAIERERFDYLVAHLAEPDFVDERIKNTKSSPEKLAKEIQKRMSDDPKVLKEMKQFLSDGEFTDTENQATATHKEIKGKQIYFRKIGERWYMDDKREEKGKKE